LNSVIRVCKVTKDRDPHANIFIKNLPPSVNVQSLEQKFSPFGLIISSKLAYSPSGQVLGYGFIQFDHEFQAKNAIKSMNNSKWDDSILSVCEYLPVTSRHFSNKTNLYIKNFPPHHDQASIRSLFIKFGEIISVGVISSKFQSLDRSFGFISFKNESDAQKACLEMHGLKEEGHEWYVAPHMSRAVRRGWLKEQYQKQIMEWKLKNLYIKNLHFSVCEKKLSDICKEYGNITSVKVLMNEHIKYSVEGEMIKEYQSKGVAFVCFEFESSATKALKDLPEKTIEGIRLFVARWIPRKELRLSIMEKSLRKKHLDLKNNTFISENSFTFKPLPVVLPRKLQIPIFRQPPQISRELIGEQLFQIVVCNSNELVAGKITGMLLEMDHLALTKLMRDRTAIRQKVLEAVEVLRDAWKDSPSQLKLLPERKM
jgi:polyadenylate-binding protein